MIEAEFIERPKLNEPLLIEGSPGIVHVAKSVHAIGLKCIDVNIKGKKQ